MSTSRITTDRDKNIILSPENPTATVIFLHGLGDTGYGWSDAMANLSKELPYVKFVLPTASSMPVTANMGMKMPAWYDIKSLSRINGKRIMPMALMNLVIVSWILFKERYMETKMVLGGILAMSGYLPRYDSFQLVSETANVPLLMCHGEKDPVVRYEYGKMSKVKLETAGVKNVEFHSYPDMEHSACMEELDDITKWLQRVLPETQH
ncbi:unnamed protein product [Peronospora belbahrii]|uniref:Phospholipase/carboxylesterase/thioesterase domain-containing protein n=1 Tax=Peronospora belbahrii TaxID=622444 RepID=A0AAU9LHI7_9STRA|nr:unnamed protein product [Peronospora belbahrii]